MPSLLLTPVAIAVVCALVTMLAAYDAHRSARRARNTLDRLTEHATAIEAEDDETYQPRGWPLA